MRLSYSLPRQRVCHASGVALVVVLAFVVLLTGLMVAFFSRALTSRQLSNSSASQTKSSLLAQSATDTIIAGFKKEIANGSKAPVALGSGSNYTNFYEPKVLTSEPAATHMVPVRYPNPANNPIPNLVRESKSDDGTNLAAPGVSSNASGINSTNDKAIGGRNVTLARWNSHYLIPRYDAETNPAVAPSQPDTSANFTAPDWVLVTRNGPAVEARITDAKGTLNDATSTNTNFVVGRYAYAVYDEGGLLDMNVAGHPTPTTPAATTGFTSTQAGRRSSLAIADLTQLPIVKSPSSAGDYLPQAMVDQIVGWRNYASAGFNTTPYPGFTFNATQAGSWFTNFANNSTGFLKVYGGPTSYSGPTDQALTSRQQLLRMRTSMGFSANVLQYLGTFSRALDQPSFQPDPNRPTITPTSVPPSVGSITAYQGNNSYAGGDGSINFVGVSGGLLSVRVTGTFPRPRLDGSTAVIGEPLIKRKFALSRLSLVTSTATAAQNNGDPIYDRFGLSRGDASSPWLYNHGANNIMTLTQVAAQNREPDMAELLKAAINVGSVGKATYTNQGSDLEYTYDVSGDRQILQIMANLIDQAKSDNYPTQIKPFTNTLATLAICGVQDLPYFYNWHFFNLTTTIPNPPLTKNDTVSAADLGGTGSGNHMRSTATTPLADPGGASCMIIPEIWNPHDANTLPAPNGGPIQFRVVAETTDLTGTLGYWQIRAQPATTGGKFDGYGSLDVPVSAKSTYTTLQIPTGADFSDAALSFTDNSGGKAFREPTLLWRDGVPSGVSLAGTFRKEASALTGKTYYGILVGDTKVSWTSTINGKEYICQTGTLCKDSPNPGSSGGIPNNLVFRMQYKAPGGQWITYQNVSAEATTQDYPSYGVFVNPAEPDYTTKKPYLNPTQVAVNGGNGTILTPGRGGPYDPRTSRFASPTLGYWDKDDLTLNGNPTLDAVTMVSGQNGGGFTLQQNQAVADSNFVLMATQRPASSRGQFYNYTNPGYGSKAAQMRWYSAADPTGGSFFGGMLSQNNPLVQLFLRENATTSGQIYYEDADHVCRRAMGAYVALSGTPSSGSRRTSVNPNSSTDNTIGLPLATASSSYASGIATASTQSQSRPIILHRPFTSVAEMGVAFRGTPWKNIDFFTPESGDTALLDVFCVNEPPADAVVAGKVNLNTQQLPVLQAVLAGAYRDELTTNKLPALSNTEAAKIASVLVDITSNSTAKSWRGPLTNVADLVGHYVNNATSPSGNDVYQYPSMGGSTYTYAGLSAALSGKTPTGEDIWDTTNVNGANTSTSTPAIQRFREAVVRPLAACGQTRVWNLMIDVVAQSGRYPQNSSTLSQFAVDGEARYWVHVAIDRLTGQVIDKQTELVNE